jgi:hypothetical protein
MTVNCEYLAHKQEDTAKSDECIYPNAVGSCTLTAQIITWIQYHTTQIMRLCSHFQHRPANDEIPLQRKCSFPDSTYKISKMVGVE